MQTAVEAGGGERAREIAERTQDAQGTFVMIRKLAGSDHADGENLTITGAGEQEIVKGDKDGYNQQVVHRSFLRLWGGSAPPFSDTRPMNDN